MSTYNFKSRKNENHRHRTSREVTTTNNKWNTTTNRFVAFFDILGFKDRIMRDSHDDIYKDLNSINDIFKKIEKEFDTNETDIYIVNFSDSIAFFSKSDTPTDFEAFITMVGYAFKEILKKKIPIKAGVAYGQVSVNKSNRIFFGQPIIDAFLLEEDLNYLGIVCHHTFDKYVADLEQKNHLLQKHKNILKKDITPLKSGKISHNNISWFRIINNDESAIEISTDQILTNLELTMSGSPRRYIDNTRDFIKDEIK